MWNRRKVKVLVQGETAPFWLRYFLCRSIHLPASVC